MQAKNREAYPALRCLMTDKAVELSLVLGEMLENEGVTEDEAPKKAIFLVRKMGELGIPFDTMNFAFMIAVLNGIRHDEKSVEAKYEFAVQQLLRFFSDEEEDDSSTS